MIGEQDRTPVAIIRAMGGLVFDAVFEESHESDLEVTDNPVETGVVVSDHAYMKPLKVTLSAGVSDTSINGWGGGYGIDSVGTAVQGGAGDGKDFWIRSAPRDAFASVSGRSTKAFELLTKLQKKAEPFNLQTGLKLYENMVCTSIRTIQDKDSANALMFQAELREVLIVSTQNVTYTPKPKPGPTARQTKPKNDKGEQQGKEVTDKKAKESLLIKGKKALFGG